MNALELHRRFRRYCAIEEGLSPLTTKAMRHSIDVLTRFTGNNNMHEIGTSELRAFFYYGSEKLFWSHATYCNYHKYLKKFFAWCVENGYRKENPLLLIKKPKKPDSLPRRLTFEEAQQILYTAFNCRWSYKFEQHRNHAIIATLLFTGIRAKELLNLSLNDINLNEQVIQISSGKNKKDRMVPIHPKLVHILKAYIHERNRLQRNCCSLFTGSSRDVPLGYRGLSLVCKKVSRQSGVKFTPHCLRHTFGSVAIEQNMGLVQLKELLGHSNISSTMIYLRMSPRGLRDSLNRIDLF